MQDPFEEGTEDDIELYSDEEEAPTSNKNKNESKSKNRRRFSDEQVRSLEKIFSSETKLEQRKKVRIARELGLQPRQVAIWFQNKRARWKSKQIENNYKLLKANYDNLKARFEVIRKENGTLLDKLQELQSLSEKSSDRNDISGLAEIDHQGTVIYSDDDKSGNMSYMARDEPGELMNIGVNIGGAAMISSVQWRGFDQSSSNSQWWDPWT